jgi:hypothetical protein
MHAGRERNILRWEARHAMLSKRLAEINEALAALGEPNGPRERERLEHLERERDEFQRRLQELGPSPSAKMG